MPDQQGRIRITLVDVVWLIVVAVLAVFPPLYEVHKQIILAAIALFQIFEGRILQGLSEAWRNAVSVLVKTALATLLVWHTALNGLSINSDYYPIYYLPIISAASLYGGLATMLWSLLSCALYWAFVIPTLTYYRFTVADATILVIRCAFFLLVAVVVNRIATESRGHALRYQKTAETLSETNRQLAQAQADARRSERLAALGQLSAGLAHEIRNPLGVIRGSAEILNQKLTPAEPLTAELAGYISSEVERLNHLVGRFLDFARPLEIEPEVQPITPIIDRALKSVQDHRPEANVRVEREDAPDLAPLPVDGELVERVFTNLFANAYDAMPEGGLLRITTGPAYSEGRRGVEVEIEDTGPGIAPGQREHIFNPFFTTKKTGLGMGLSMVSKIVDDHHGWIRLASEPGKGARFRLFFPEGNVKGKGSDA
ncbi:MAG TPA: ATP-binding protein [Terriglobia bacterium]|nr:ATP-binding protein [Terriglobia bacterium]